MAAIEIKVLEPLEGGLLPLAKDLQPGRLYIADDAASGGPIILMPVQGIVMSWLINDSPNVKDFLEMNAPTPQEKPPSIVSGMPLEDVLKLMAVSRDPSLMKDKI